MSDVFGKAPGATTSTWNGFDFVDRTLQLPVGATITALALHNNAATTATPKIMKRAAGSNQFTAVQVEAPFSHPGGGYGWATLSTSFAVPNDGFEYYPNWRVNGTLTRSVEPTSRSSRSGDLLLNITGTFVADTLGHPPMGYRTANGDPPPPPPSPLIYCFGVLLSQSGAELWGPGTAFKDRFLELTGKTAEFKNYAVGSSFLRKVSTYAHWDPMFAGNLLDDACDDFAAFIAADANRRPVSFISKIGESCCAPLREEASAQHMIDLADRVAYTRARTGFNIPVIVVELHKLPSGYPYAPVIRAGQRQVVELDASYGAISDAHLVSSADLPAGSGILHLTSADWTTELRRLAEKAATLPLPEV